MLLGAYSGKMGRAAVYFLPKKCTMNSERYIELLETHFLQMFSLYECQIFMQDGAPCHKSKKVMKWFKNHNITLLEWPGNSPDLNPIENCWNYIKKQVVDSEYKLYPKTHHGTEIAMDLNKTRIL